MFYIFRGLNHHAVQRRLSADYLSGMSPALSPHLTSRIPQPSNGTPQLSQSVKPSYKRAVSDQPSIARVVSDQYPSAHALHDQRLFTRAVSDQPRSPRSVPRGPVISKSAGELFRLMDFDLSPCGLRSLMQVLFESTKNNSFKNYEI